MYYVVHPSHELTTSNKYFGMLGEFWDCLNCNCQLNDVQASLAKERDNDTPAVGDPSTHKACQYHPVNMGLS